MADFNPTILSDMAIHPGEFLRDELEARGMTPAQLAERAGLALQVIDGIVSERDVIREDVADDIGRALGTSAQSWVNATTLYYMVLERNARHAADRGSAAC